MTGRLVDMSLSLDRRQRVTIELEPGQDFRETFDQLKDAVLDVEIKKHHKKRSLDANAYAWLLINKLSVILHISPNEVYRQHIRDVGGNFEVVPVQEGHLEHWDRLWCKGHDGRMTVDMGPCRNIRGYHNVRSYFGSSDFDTAHMSRLIDNLIQDCKAQGIETLTERELSLLKEAWGKDEVSR